MPKRNNINKKVKKILDLLKDDKEENNRENKNNDKKKEKDTFKSNPNVNNITKDNFNNKKEVNNRNKEKEKENLLSNFNIFINEEDIPYEEEDKNITEDKDKDDEMKKLFESNTNINENNNYKKMSECQENCQNIRKIVRMSGKLSEYLK